MCLLGGHLPQRREQSLAADHLQWLDVVLAAGAIGLAVMHLASSVDLPPMQASKYKQFVSNS